MMKELKQGGMELKEKKVLVVGDAAVGKTTLLRGLGGESEVVAKVATDGIEIGELYLGGVKLYCWDFAGQEVYRYTHQLFLSDSAVYLVLFDLKQAVRSICSQVVAYWLALIGSRASASPVILVGTHASLVPPQKIEESVAIVTQKFGGDIVGKVLVVDSVTGEGLSNMKDALTGVALGNMPCVPRLFEDIRQFFEKYRKIHQNEHFIEANRVKGEVEKDGAVVGLTLKSWEWSLRMLDCLGSIALVDWDRHIGNQRVHSTFVILRPSWLVGVVKTVVTMRHNFVKDGVVLIETLRREWSRSGYDESIHELLFETLEKFDVVCRLSGRGEGKVIVPCLLPDCVPQDFNMRVQNDEQCSLSDLGKDDGGDGNVCYLLRSCI